MNNLRQTTRNTTQHTDNNDDITAIELVPNHSPQKQRTERQQQRFTSSVIQPQSIDSRQRSTQTKRKIADIHV